MDTRIQDLLRQITALEDDLRTALHERESRIQFAIHGKRIQFEQGVRKAHRRLKRNFFRWLATDRRQNLITGPVIYGMAIPLAILDVFVTLYQATCFPIYGTRFAARPARTTGCPASACCIIARGVKYMFAIEKACQDAFERSHPARSAGKL